MQKSQLLVLLDQLAALLRRISDLLPGKVTPPQPAPVPAPLPPPDPSDVLLETARSFLGRDASPADVAPDEFGCAETVTDIIHAAFADFPPDGKTIVSTTTLYQRLRAHPKFKMTLDPVPGSIIISPTGYGNGGLANGHTGIFDQGQKIMSNDSRTGLFKMNYTLDSWVARYRKIGGFPIFIFRRVG